MQMLKVKKEISLMGLLNFVMTQALGLIVTVEVPLLTLKTFK